MLPGNYRRSVFGLCVIGAIMVHSKGHTEKDILGGFSSRRKAPLAMSLVGRVDLPAVLGRQVLVGEATYKASTVG